MLRKDRILNEFLKHEIIVKELKDKQKQVSLPLTTEMAKESKNIIISVIGHLVDQLDRGTSSAEGIHSMLMKKIISHKD